MVLFVPGRACVTAVMVLVDTKVCSSTSQQYNDNAPHKSRLFEGGDVTFLECKWGEEEETEKGELKTSGGHELCVSSGNKRTSEADSALGSPGHKCFVSPIKKRKGRN